VSRAATIGDVKATLSPVLERSRRLLFFTQPIGYRYSLSVSTTTLPNCPPLANSSLLPPYSPLGLSSDSTFRLHPDRPISPPQHDPFQFPRQFAPTFTINNPSILNLCFQPISSTSSISTILLLKRPYRPRSRVLKLPTHP
jgi:hypothetical protein